MEQHRILVSKAISGVVFLGIGTSMGWLGGYAASADRFHLELSQAQAQQKTLSQQIASQSAQLSQANDQISGYQQYVIAHTEQSVDPQYLTGFILPVDNLQPHYDNPLTLPGSPRDYRGGIHEGVDFFPGKMNTPIKAVKDGEIIRIDSDYTNPPSSYLDELSSLTEQIHFTPDDILDKFRGRQIWLLVPGNVVVRYCHLNSVGNFKLGDKVKQGQVIAGMGDSGTMDDGIHLHFEVRIGNTYLGRGMSTDQLIQSYKHLFSKS